MRLNLSLVLQIAFVGHDDDGEKVLVLYLCFVSSRRTVRPNELTLRICWWNVETSSKELRDVME